MSGFTRIAALALPVLLAAACSGKNDDNANAANANMPAPADTAGMYAPPPPTTMDTSMMHGDTMRHDSMGADTTRM